MKLHAQQRINPVPNYPPNSAQKKLKHTRKSNKSLSNYNLCDTGKKNTRDNSAQLVVEKDIKIHH